MQIAYHLYQLHYKENYGTVAQGKTRQGALLRITSEDGLIGYCDCHPWFELGDLPLPEQLSLLAQNQRTPLLECSLEFARLDAEARRDQRSLFEGMTIPPSHQLVDLSANIQELSSQGISHFKLKTGTCPEKEISAMESWDGVHLRLDFNEKLSRQAFLEYWGKIPLKTKQQIDFVEAPYPYDADAWSKDQEMLGVAFAADRSALKAFAHYHVHKPAVEKTPELPDKNVQLVVTSYLDHPLGQMCAAYTAGKLKALYPDQVSYCGLLTHKCYQDDPFIRSVYSVGPQLFPSQGTGFGFDELLKELPWQSL